MDRPPIATHLDGDDASQELIAGAGLPPIKHQCFAFACYERQLMSSPLNEAWESLCHAEEAWKAADQLTDPDAKEVMIQISRYYHQLALTALARAWARECGLTSIH